MALVPNGTLFPILCAMPYIVVHYIGNKSAIWEATMFHGGSSRFKSGFVRRLLTNGARDNPR